MQAYSDPTRESEPTAMSESRNADLIAALQKLIELHYDWEPGGRATRRFCRLNDEAINAARAAIAAAKDADHV